MNYKNYAVTAALALGTVGGVGAMDIMDIKPPTDVLAECKRLRLLENDTLNAEHQKIKA